MLGPHDFTVMPFVLWGDEIKPEFRRDYTFRLHFVMQALNRHYTGNFRSLAEAVQCIREWQKLPSDSPFQGITVEDIKTDGNIEYFQYLNGIKPDILSNYKDMESF